MYECYFYIFSNFRRPRIDLFESLKKEVYEMSIQIVENKTSLYRCRKCIFSTKKSNFRCGSEIFNMKLNVNFFKATTSKIVKFSFKHKSCFFVL